MRHGSVLNLLGAGMWVGAIIIVTAVFGLTTSKAPGCKGLRITHLVLEVIGCFFTVALVAITSAEIDFAGTFLNENVPTYIPNIILLVLALAECKCISPVLPYSICFSNPCVFGGSNGPERLWLEQRLSNSSEWSCRHGQVPQAGTEASGSAVRCPARSGNLDFCSWFFRLHSWSFKALR